MNNNFLRQGQGQNNRNRNRNRPRHRSTGGGSSNNSGGNSANKVFDSNGPDVKLRGTSQTIAEKYMQLGRDAQSSGDSVSAESYYQHAEHYYRLWASNQPAGSSLLMSRKLGEEEFEEDAEGGDDEAPEGQNVEPSAAESAEANDAPQGEGEPPHSGNTNRNTNNRERFKPRWQQRRDRWQTPAEGSAETGAPDTQIDVQSAPVADETPAPAPASDQWEAPSFLQRPTPAPVGENTETEPEVPRALTRRPRQRREREEPAATVDETPHRE